MIVVFGASSDLGRRVAGSLLDAGKSVRLVAQNPWDLDPRAERLIGGAEQAASATQRAQVVISCAHARHTQTLLDNLAPEVGRIVLTGSAWCNSMVPDPRADEVRAAEAVFLRSGRKGVMLHPTMIYDGSHENNLRRVFETIRRSPIVPLPGGGKHRVQPIHIDDMTASIFAASGRDWSGPAVIHVAGPRPFPWRAMVAECMEAIGTRRPTLHVPLAPAIAALKFANRIGLPIPIEPGILERFRENVNVSIETMQTELGVTPREFSVGIRQALAGWGSFQQSGQPAKGAVT